MIGADTLEMLPTFQCLISMLMLLAQASNHLISTIFYRAEPSTFYGCWLLKKLLLLLPTKISIVRVKKNTATSCQCCAVSSVCCWWSERPTSENRVSMLHTMRGSDDRYDSHCAEYLLYISLQLYFLANTRAMHCTGAPPPTHFIKRNNFGKDWDRGMAARKERGQHGETVEKVDKKHLEI